MNLVQKNVRYLTKYDKEVGCAIADELKRQRSNLELIASENIVSPAVMAAMGSCLTNKYAEGYPGKRYYGGCVNIDKVEQLAIDRVKKLFGAKYANVQPHSGAQANMAVQFAVLQPGDTMIGMALDCAGHLTHGSKANISGKIFNAIQYGVTKDGFLDYEDLERKIDEHLPKLICVGASAYSREIDYELIREIIDRQKEKHAGYDPVYWVDMAHVAGLIAAGLIQSPVGCADVITSTTHKTLRGPRGGFILSTEECNKKYNFNKAVFPMTQGGPLEHIIAAKAVCFGEAAKEDFKAYQKNVIANAKELAKQMSWHGFNVITGGTDNHMMLIDLDGFDGLTGKEMQERCDEVNITLNKNMVPYDTQKPSVTSGIRIGTPAITSEGFKPEEMKRIADILFAVATKFELYKTDILQDVQALMKQHIVYK